ncbi:MAG: hypothetical protein K2Q97_08050 [Burkholderiaceae bacterium]|nr:hypothetical protein [Burkholderiaceae bacterium]
MKHHHTFIPRLAALALACACASAQADTLEGTLERGPAHSVLWAVSLESGDLIGQLFANASQAGQTILAHCLPGLHCVAEGVSTAEPPDGLTEKLLFSAQPSGWWLITHASSAHMQPSLPMSERQLHTRHGQLTITDEYVLLFNGRPVLANAPQLTEPPSSAAPHTLLERINAWWQNGWSQILSKLLALLGRMPAPPPAAAQPEPVQGNAALHIVAHFELEGQDTVLLQDTGGTACPALYRFATLTRQGIAVTPEFGTCSDLAAVTLKETTTGAQEPLVTMVGTLDAVEPGQESPRMRLHHFALRQGQAQELQAQR